MPGNHTGRRSRENHGISGLSALDEKSRLAGGERGPVEADQGSLGNHGKTLGVLRARQGGITGRAESQEEMMLAYRPLVAVAVPTRQAAALVGVSRTSVYRKPAPPVDREPVVPSNTLSPAERSEILIVLNSPEFVDLTHLAGLRWQICLPSTDVPRMWHSSLLVCDLASSWTTDHTPSRRSTATRSRNLALDRLMVCSAKFQYRCRGPAVSLELYISAV